MACGKNIFVNDSQLILARKWTFYENLVGTGPEYSVSGLNGEDEENFDVENTKEFLGL